MARYAECDNCGSRDDWCMSTFPFFVHGAVIKIRDDNGAEEFIHEMELCPNCKDELFKAFPKLKKCLDEA